MTSVSLVERKMDPSASRLVRMAGRVDEVAVVGDGQRAARVIDEQRLRVAQVGDAGGGVAVVADRQASGQARQAVLGKHVVDPPHADLGLHGFAVRRHDAGAFLAAVLQGIEPQVGQLGGLGRTVDADDGAFVVKFIRVHWSATLRP